MRAAIYVRISDDKEGAGLGVARQEKDCREGVCDPRQWSVAGVYADNDRSAYSGKSRPQYERMLEDARNGHIDAIVAWHTDRLHRSPTELETFIAVVETRSIHVETVRAGHLDLSTPSGRMVARQLGAVARYESEHKSDRQKAKASEIARNGGVAGGGTRPFGFEADRMTLRQDEADIVRDLAERFLAGETLRGLCGDLERRGITTPAGKGWTSSPLRRMLRSARISGQREHHGEIVATAQWPAIITPEQTTRIRALLDDPARQATRAPRSYVLTGLVRCGLCDTPLVARPRDDGQRRYVCASGPQVPGCGKTYVLSEPVEELVTEAVLHRLGTAELADAVRGAHVGDRSQAQIDGLTAKLDELAAAYAADSISMREWLAAREPLQLQLDSAKRTLARTGTAGILGVHVGNGDALRDQWPTLGIDRRRAILGATLVRVIVNPGRRGYNRFDPGRVDVEWRY